MNNCDFKMPGIRAVSILPCSMLPADIMLKSMAGIPVTLLTDKQESVPFFGLPVLESSTEYKNGGYVQATKLTLRSTAQLPRNVPVAFIVDCNDGSRWIIGTRERPYPIINGTATTGEADGDGAVTEYEISLTAAKSLIRLQK